MKVELCDEHNLFNYSPIMHNNGMMMELTRYGVVELSEILDAGVNGRKSVMYWQGCQWWMCVLLTAISTLASSDILYK